MEGVTLACGNNFPVVVQLCSDGSVILRRTVESFCDVDDAAISGIFDGDGFSLREYSSEAWMNFSYDVPYKLATMPVLKAWLMQQNLIYPVLKEPVLNTI